jgi:hypothetical protein
MHPTLVQIKLDERLNKLASENYVNIECWQKREAINKAQLEWVRRQIHGINLSKEGDEQSRIRVDDLQHLIEYQDLNTTNKGIYTESETLPENYGWFKSVRIYGSSENCSDQLILDIHQIEESNVNEWLNDWSKQPSFEFSQCFYTLANNKVNVYTNKEFKISKLTLVYYRFPTKFDIEGCEWYDGSNGVDKDLNFKDDVAELIIDEAASILAGDTEHISAYQITNKRKEENN